MYQPLVSIITPTYRHEAFIGQCIESVLGQTYANWEQIIVDDCSPDRTEEIARSYRDPRIKVVRKPERGGPAGLHVSYNTALQMARGELVAVLEGDDYWPTDKLAIQVPVHEDRDLVLSWGPYAERPDGPWLVHGKRCSTRERCFPDTSYLLVRNIIPALTVVARHEALLRIGRFWQPEGTVFVDHPTWLRLSTLGGFLYLPRLLGYYRLHASQISQTHGERMNFHMHRYPAEFVGALSPEQRERVDLPRVRALQAAFAARACIRRGAPVRLIRLLASALAQGGFRQAPLCLKVLCNSSDLP